MNVFRKSPILTINSHKKIFVSLKRVEGESDSFLSPVKSESCKNKTRYTNQSKRRKLVFIAITS